MHSPQRFDPKTHEQVKASRFDQFLNRATVVMLVVLAALLGVWAWFEFFSH